MGRPLLPTWEVPDERWNSINSREIAIMLEQGMPPSRVPAVPQRARLISDAYTVMETGRAPYVRRNHKT